MAQLMPLPLTVSCFSKIQIGFTILVPAHPGSHGQRAVQRVRVYCTDSCSATIMILSSVATPKNCTIKRRQRYFRTVCRLNISRTVSPLFLLTAFSLLGIEPIRFCRVVKEIDLQDFRRRRSSAVSVCGSRLALAKQSAEYCIAHYHRTKLIRPI